mmetsp:Transcript_81439/g.174358  ORF Transcript_81439/g.174358 Transcript_81439/m.174358 type:complete len:505 (+) Transcript_81439:260-1774(+)
MRLLAQPVGLPRLLEQGRCFFNLRLGARHGPRLRRSKHPDERECVAREALVEVTSLLSHGKEDLHWQHVAVLHAEEIGRVLGNLQCRDELLGPRVQVHPPTEAFLRHADEGLQGVRHAQLASLPSTKHVQVRRQLPQWRHLVEHRHLHDILGEADAVGDEEALPCRAQGRQGHKLTAALCPHQGLSVVGLRHLRLEGGEDLKNASQLLREARLVASVEEVEEHLGSLCELVLCVGLVLIPPVGAPPLHCVQQSLNGADAIVIASHGVCVGLHSAEDALREFAPCGARASRGGSSIANAHAVDAGCILLDARVEGTLNRRRKDAVAQGLIRLYIRRATPRHGQDRLLPPLAEAIGRLLGFHLQVCGLPLLQEHIEAGIGGIAPQVELVRLQGGLQGLWGVASRRVELHERGGGAKLAIVRHGGPRGASCCCGVGGGDAVEAHLVQATHLARVLKAQVAKLVGLLHEAFEHGGGAGELQAVREAKHLMEDFRVRVGCDAGQDLEES